MIPRRCWAAAILLATLALPGCYALRSPAGGGRTSFDLPRWVMPGDVAHPDGYTIEPVATGLTFPTGDAFDATGRVSVIEAGYSPMHSFPEALIPDAEVATVADYLMDLRRQAKPR